MNENYTIDTQFLASVKVGSRYYLDPSCNSPSLAPPESVLLSGFVVQFNSPQIFQNIVPLADLSIADVPVEGLELMDFMKIQEAKEYFRENKSEILKRYEGRFVAILENSVVDDDEDFSELAQRVYSKYGYGAIYMPFVESEPTVIRMPSPRVMKTKSDASHQEL